FWVEGYAGVTPVNDGVMTVTLYNYGYTNHTGAVSWTVGRRVGGVYQIPPGTCQPSTAAVVVRSGISGFGEFGTSQAPPPARLASEPTKTPQADWAFEVLAYPNPTESDLMLRINSPVTSLGAINIMNLSGISLVNKQFSIELGENEIPIDLTDLPAATYLLQVRVGEYESHQRIVKLK
ncbi:MAG: T9SS type A sorting domain-containing protein, partial [Bacteroidia bacterium]|nr:T9SS type A sorting domain-containing protein [Bacteroidia bacterium]